MGTQPTAPDPAPVPGSVAAPAPGGAHDRPDACPGALRPFGATDGAIARVRLAGAPLTVAQARGIADLADRLGDGEVSFTTRANVQVRGLSAEGVTQFAQDVADLGLLPSATHDRVRNLVVSPFCCPRVIALADAIDRAVCARPALAALSGRFLMGVDDGSGYLLALPLDIGMQAHAGAGGQRVRLRLGSDVRGYDAGSLDDPDAVAERVAQVAEAFVPLAADEGAWNVDDLSLEAADALHAVVEGLLPATSSPTVVRTQPDLAGPVDVAPLPGQAGEPARTWLCATAPLTAVPSAGWRALTDVAEAADGVIRVTPWHAVVVPGVDPAQADAAVARLAATGWVVSADSAWLGVHGCTGSPRCARSHTPVHEHTRDAVATGSFDLPVSIVGCTRRCGHPSVEHVDVVATGPDRYEVSVHDGTRGPQPGPVATARPDELADVVRGVIARHGGPVPVTDPEALQHPAGAADPADEDARPADPADPAAPSDDEDPR